jgi:ribosomal protein S18 acetylase RimI-like enzyme
MAKEARKKVAFSHEYDESSDSHVAATVSGHRSAGTEKTPLEGVEGFGRITRGSKVVGLLQWYSGGGIAHIEADPAYRGRGVATALFREARRIDPSIKLRGDWSAHGSRWYASMRRRGEG